MYMFEQMYVLLAKCMNVLIYEIRIMSYPNHPHRRFSLVRVGL